ncbi:MAG: hypothetical protein V3S17_03225 [candidate division Zixibacteria bacterium]
MRSFLLILCAVILVAATPAYSSKVKSIELDKANGFTVAKINVKGKIRFTHQTEIAKDGKPFRIIVDILSATHDLSAKTYEQLPDCRITSIRTSQYAVKPEKIVRIVLDMKGESTYRIESQNNSVFLFVYDKESKPFASWSSDSYKKSVPAEKPAVTAEPDKSSFAKIASINKALDDDRKSSLESAESKPFIYPRKEPSSAKKPSSEISVPKIKKPSTTKKLYSPEIDGAPQAKTSSQELATADKKPVTKKLAVKPSSLTKPTGNSVPSTKKETIKTAKVTRRPSTAASKPAQSKTPQAKKIKSKDSGKSASQSKLKKTGPPVSPNNAKAGKLAKSSSSKSSKKTTLAKNANAKKSSANKKKSSKSTTVAKTDKKVKKSSTARFRRSPAQLRKIKGTMVAEFPKRLVIKYKGKRYRDPFETLINETRISNSLVEKRVPNVEGLKLVGVLEAAGEGNRALFEDKDGFGYILSAGDKVQKGYVLRVDMEKVYFQIFEYGWSRTVALNMDSY